LVRVKFPCRGQEANVAFADQVDERKTSVLILLRDRDDEPQIALDELLKGFPISGPDFPSEVQLLGAFEEGIRTDLIQVLIEDVPFWLAGRDASRRGPPPTRLRFGRGVVVLDLYLHHP
jgi:hypothetical protein